MIRLIKIVFKAVLFLLLCLVLYFFVGWAPKREPDWGVNFSAKHARSFGLDPRKVYSAILKDLGAKTIKLVTYWDEIEKERDNYDFSKIDWYIKKAEEHEVKILLVTGMKTPRWPECHPPGWTKDLSPKERGEEVRELVKKTTERYINSKAVWGFQVENEPFLGFGECPERPRGFLRKEVETVRRVLSSTEEQKPVVISDSGEWSFWSRAARLGDMVATTIYRTAWFAEAKRYTTYPLPPVFYWRKALIIKTFFGKEVFCGELQAEPWGPVLLYDLPRKEQKKTMTPQRFDRTIDYAQKTGLEKFYLWGAEWWYLLKQNGEPEMWNKAQKLFLEKEEGLK